MKEKKFWVCANLAGLGPRRLSRLLDIYGSIENIFQLELNQLQEVGVPQKVAKKIKYWEDLPWEKEILLCQQNNIKLVIKSDTEYPFLLKQIHDPPYMLYVKGNIPTTDISISIVGTRHPSLYGLKMAEKLATELAYYGFTIISGLARGIDAAAHRGALKGSGKTVGVLGSGFKNFYPKENLKLSDKIKDNGAVITEFNLFAQPEPTHFPIRNRIVAGMSKGTLVIEAGQRSGALITANLAVEEGREVFALPGQVDNIFSKGVNKLLKEGAALVEDVQDILDLLNLKIEVSSPKKEKNGKNLTLKEKKVVDCFGEKKLHIEELILLSGLPFNQLSDVLISLVIKEEIVELPGKIYSKKQI